MHAISHLPALFSVGAIRAAITNFARRDAGRPYFHSEVAQLLASPDG